MGHLITLATYVPCADSRVLMSELIRRPVGSSLCRYLKRDARPTDPLQLAKPMGSGLSGLFLPRIAFD